MFTAQTSATIVLDALLQYANDQPSCLVMGGLLSNEFKDILGAFVSLMIREKRDFVLIIT